MRRQVAIALLSASAAMIFAAPAWAFKTSPYCAGTFGYGSDGKMHCDVGQFNNAKKSGKKYQYDPAKAGKKLK